MVTIWWTIWQCVSYLRFFPQFKKNQFIIYLIWKKILHLDLGLEKLSVLLHCKFLDVIHALRSTFLIHRMLLLFCRLSIQAMAFSQRVLTLPNFVKLKGLHLLGLQHLLSETWETRGSPSLCIFLIFSFYMVLLYS